MAEEKMVKTSVAFPESLWKEGRKRAIDEDRDFQDIVTDALREYLQRKKEVHRER
jgi:metal-responsive CopG/Arc/MetJ family transcriptional regulator